MDNAPEGNWGINLDIDEMHELAHTFKPDLEWEPNPRDSSKILGLFYKVIEKEQTKEENMCIEYFILFDEQVLPAHPFDYEPIFVYIDADQNVTRVVYDKYHYCASTIKPDKERHQKYFDEKGHPMLRIFYLWHGLSPVKETQTNFSPELINLDDETLNEWHNREGEAKFIIPSSYLEDPFQIEKYFKPINQKGKVLCRIKNLFRARQRKILSMVRDRLGVSERFEAGFKLERGWIRDLVMSRADEGPTLKFMQDCGLIEIENGEIRLTKDGALFYNTP